MTIVDLSAKILSLRGITLLVYAVGRFLYSAPSLRKDWMSGSGYCWHWARPNTNASREAYWLGGRSSQPKPLAVDRPWTKALAIGRDQF